MKQEVFTADERKDMLIEHTRSAANVEVLTYSGLTVEFARKNNHDVVLLDTAGRLHIDDVLMNELAEVQKRTQPHEILRLNPDPDAPRNTAKSGNAIVPMGSMCTTGFSDTRPCKRAVSSPHFHATHACAHSWNVRMGMKHRYITSPSNNAF
jgi:hypothetical protein